MEELRTVVEDDVLISRAQSGDEQAFVDLMRAYHAFVYAIVIGMVNNSHDAEDVVQEVFINTYRRLSQLEDTTKFKSWLAEVARNCARNWQRTQRMDTVSINNVSEGTLQTADSPEKQLIRDEELEMIRRTMNTLSQKDRDIARSYYLEGVSYDELIRAHGLSYKAISFRLSRAKRTLAKRLQYLLNAAFVPPVISLNKISSGGFTAMKIGTIPKVTAGVVAIIVIVFIGLHQLLPPNDGPSSSIKATVSTTSKPEQSEAEIETSLERVVTVPKRADEPQISAEEMEQVEDFFAQLEEADAQSETDVPQRTTDAEELGETYIDESASDTKQSAEDVMNAYVTAYKNLDFEAMLPLVTGSVRKGVESSLRFFDGELPDEVVNGIADNIPEEMIDDVLQTMREQMSETAQKMKDRGVLGQLEIVSSGHVGKEFHFQLRRPMMEMSEDSGILHKMRKENGVWRIYDIETYMMKFGEPFFKVEKILTH